MLQQCFLYRGLDNYLYYFGGSLLLVMVIVFWAPQPYSNFRPLCYIRLCIFRGPSSTRLPGMGRKEIQLGGVCLGV